MEGAAPDEADGMLAAAFTAVEATPPREDLAFVQLGEFASGSGARAAARDAPTTAALRQQPNELFFDELDTNHDGVLSRNEFAARRSMRAEHLAQSQSSVLPGAKRRSPYKPTLRLHAETQTEAAEVGDLQQLRATVSETTDKLEGLQTQISAAATSASQQFATRVEEKVAVVQAAASDRLLFVEGKYEDALARARHAADTERTHELAKLKAQQDEAMRRLNAEYEQKHTNETSHLLRERDEYKDKYEEAEHGMRSLRKDLARVMEGERRKISKEEYDTVKTEARKQRDLAERYKQAEKAALAEKEAARQTARTEIAKAAQVVKESAEAKRDAASATAAAHEEVEEVRRQAAEQVELLNRKLRAVTRAQSDTSRELENERALRSIISERQATAIKKVVAENTRLKEQMETLLRNTRPGRGAWTASETGEVAWVEEKPPGAGVHSGVDTLGFSQPWKSYGQAGGVSAPSHPLTAGFRRPTPPLSSRDTGTKLGSATLRAPSFGRRARGRGSQSARAVTAM